MALAHAKGPYWTRTAFTKCYNWGGQSWWLIGVRIAHLRIAHQVANPEVGNPEGILSVSKTIAWLKQIDGQRQSALDVAKKKTQMVVAIKYKYKYKYIVAEYVESRWHLCGRRGVKQIDEGRQSGAISHLLCHVHLVIFTVVMIKHNTNTNIYNIWTNKKGGTLLICHWWEEVESKWCGNKFHYHDWKVSKAIGHQASWKWNKGLLKGQRHMEGRANTGQTLICRWKFFVLQCLNVCVSIIMI